MNIVMSYYPPPVWIQTTKNQLFRYIQGRFNYSTGVRAFPFCTYQNRF